MVYRFTEVSLDKPGVRCLLELLLFVKPRYLIVRSSVSVGYMIKDLCAGEACFKRPSERKRVLFHTLGKEYGQEDKDLRE